MGVTVFFVYSDWLFHHLSLRSIYPTLSDDVYLSINEHLMRLFCLVTHDVVNTNTPVVVSL